MKVIASNIPKSVKGGKGAASVVMKVKGHGSSKPAFGAGSTPRDAGVRRFDLSHRSLSRGGRKM